MRASTLFDRVRSRHVLPLALCAGVIALSGCPKMPRITTVDPKASATPSTAPKPSPSPSASISPNPSPSPEEEPTLATMTVGSSPQGIVIDPTGNGYVTLADDLVRIDGATGNLSNRKVTSLKNEGYTFDSPSGIVLVGSTPWFTDTSRRAVRRIKEDSPGNTDDFAFGEAPSRLVKDSQHNLWIADYTDPEDSIAYQVGILKPDGFSTPVSVTLDGRADDLIVDLAGSGWVVTTNGDTVKITKLTRPQDSSELKLIASKPIELTALGGGVGLAIDDSNTLWVTGVSKGGIGQLMRLDANGTPTVDYNFNFIPGRFAIRKGYAWIPDLSDSGFQINKVSLATGQVIKSYPIGGRAAGVFKDDSGDLWVPIRSSNTVVKLDF